MKQLTRKKKQEIDELLDRLAGAIDYKGDASQLLHKIKQEVHLG